VEIYYWSLHQLIVFHVITKSILTIYNAIVAAAYTRYSIGKLDGFPHIKRLYVLYES